MKLLHPFLPFITEEIWHWRSLTTGDSIMISVLSAVYRPGVLDFPDDEAVDGQDNHERYTRLSATAAPR